MAKAKEILHGLSHKFLRNHNEFRVIQNYNALASISGYRAIYLNDNGEVGPADHYSPNIIGFHASNTTVAATGSVTGVVGGPAYAYPQSAIEPLLPIKVTEAGRITHGVIKTHSGRTILSATDGTDDEITDSDANNEYITVESDDSSDTTQIVYVYVKEKTTGTAKMLYGYLNGTSEVILRDFGGGGGQVYVDEVYGARLSAEGAGTITIKNYTSNTTLISFSAGTTTRGVTSATNPTYSYCRDVIVLFNQQKASQELFIAGTDLNGNPQYEIITHGASSQLQYQTSNRWRTVDYIVNGKIDSSDPTTTTITGLGTNVFETSLVNEVGVGSYTAANQVGFAAGEKLKIKSDDASDDGKIVLLGIDDTASGYALRYDEITLNGTTAVATTNDYSYVLGAYISSVETQVDGTITVYKNDGTSAILSFDAASYNAIGIFGPEGHSTDTGVHSLFDIPGCNAVPTFTLSNTSAQDLLVIKGEDVDGTAQYEFIQLDSGVGKSEYAWSRINAIAGVGCAGTEYLKVSFETEDNPALFCGFSMGAADAQSTSSAVEIWVESAYNVERGKTADRSKFQEIATLVGSDGDYGSVNLAIADVSAGELILQVSDLVVELESAALSKAVTYKGFGDDVTISSALSSDATLDVTAAGVEVHDLIIKNTNNGSGDIACLVSNVSAKFVNVEFDGGTHASGVALDLNADGADITEFYDCTFTDGLVDADGNASSIARFFNCRAVDEINLGTAGTYYFYGCNLGTLTVGAGTTAYIVGSQISTLSVAPTGIVHEVGNYIGTYDGPAVNSGYVDSHDPSQHLVYYDDFLGDVLRDEWAVSNAGGGDETDFAIVDGINGTAVGTTGLAAVDRYVQLDWGTFENFHAGLHAGIEARLKVDDVTSVEIEFGFYKDADEYALLYVDVSDKTDASIYAKASLSGGAGATDNDTTEDLANGTYVVLQIQTFDDGSVKYYVDGTLKRTDPASTIATSTQLMRPHFKINNEATAARSMTIDYVKIWQERS